MRPPRFERSCTQDEFVLRGEMELVVCDLTEACHSPQWQIAGRRPPWRHAAVCACGRDFRWPMPDSRRSIPSHLLQPYRVFDRDRIEKVAETGGIQRSKYIAWRDWRHTVRLAAQTWGLYPLRKQPCTCNDLTVVNKTSLPEICSSIRWCDCCCVIRHFRKWKALVHIKCWSLECFHHSPYVRAIMGYRWRGRPLEPQCALSASNLMAVLLWDWPNPRIFQFGDANIRQLNMQLYIQIWNSLFRSGNWWQTSRSCVFFGIDRKSQSSVACLSLNPTQRQITCGILSMRV